MARGSRLARTDLVALAFAGFAYLGLTVGILSFFVDLDLDLGPFSGAYAVFSILAELAVAIGLRLRRSWAWWAAVAFTVWWVIESIILTAYGGGQGAFAGTGLMFMIYAVLLRLLLGAELRAEWALHRPIPEVGWFAMLSPGFLFVAGAGLLLAEFFDIFAGIGFSVVLLILGVGRRFARANNPIQPTAKGGA